MSKKVKVARRHIELPTPYYVHAMAEIESQTPRGAVIVATAYLDLLLRMIIERVMRPEPEIQDVLFENRGPLQGFSARIRLAFALKLIGSGAYLDLCTLRDIRNAFAHSAEAIDFDRPDVAALCESLWYPRKVHMKDHPDPQTPREFFLRAIHWLVDGLYEDFNAPQGYTPWPTAFIMMGPPWPPKTPEPLPKKQRPQSRPGGPPPNKKTET